MQAGDQLTTHPAPGAPPPQGEPRYPWRAFGLTLALIAVLAGGLFVGLRLTSEPTSVSSRVTATQSANTSLTVAPTAVAAPVSTSAPAPVGTAAPARTAQPRATTAPEPAAAPTPATNAPGAPATSVVPESGAPSGQVAPTLIQPAGPTGEPAAATAAPAVALGEPAPTPNPTPQPISLEVRPDIDPNLARDIQRAYALYWARRAEAFYLLDVKPLLEVTAEKELDGSGQLIEQLREEGRAGETVVSHNAVLLSAADADAAISDQYQDSSYYIDPVTKQPLTSDRQSYTFKDVFRLRKLDGVWKVVGGERYD